MKRLPDSTAFCRFLLGYNLPPLSDDLPPYLNGSLEAIREWGLKGLARDKLFLGIAGCVDRLGLLFKGQEETDWESWAEPLFQLCSLLPDEPRLGKPLFRLFEWFEEAVKRGDQRLTLEIRSAFTSALLENAPAGKLLPALQRIRRDPQSDPVLFASPEEIRSAIGRIGCELMREPGKNVKKAALRIWGLQFETQHADEFKRMARQILHETLPPAGWGKAEMLFHAGSAIVCGAYEFEFKWNDRCTRWILQALDTERLYPNGTDLPAAGGDRLRAPEARLVEKIVSFLPPTSTPAIDLRDHFL